MDKRTKKELERITAISNAERDLLKGLYADMFGSSSGTHKKSDTSKQKSSSKEPSAADLLDEARRKRSDPMEDARRALKEAEDLVFKVRSEFTVDDILYLSSTGRVSPLVAKIANLLRIKVMLKGSNESTIELTKKVHGRKIAIKSLINTCLEKIVDKNQTIYITHCDCEEDALSVKNGLMEGGINHIEVYPYDLITGSHVGPGCVALFYIGENRD